MIAAQAVDAALRRISEDVFFQRGMPNTLGDVLRGRKRLARSFVFDELDADQQAEPADVTDVRMRQQGSEIAAQRL